MTALDWKYPDLAWDATRARGASHADVLADLHQDRFAVLALRRGGDGREYAVCVRDGWFWLARLRDSEEYDGAGSLVEVCPTDVRYHDDAEIVEPSA